MNTTGDWALAMQKMKDKKKIPQKKKGNRGGYRKGAGKKKTGINNKHIGMSVPIKYAELLKAMVKSKIAELRGLKNQGAVVKPLPVKNGKVVSEIKKNAPKSNHKPNTDYLQKRRNDKLKIKEN